jgi:hypothetical protein
VKIILILLFLAVTPKTVFALSAQTIETLNFQFGTWLENYAQVRSNTNDDTNGFELIPYISTSLNIRLPYELSAIPELGWVIQRTEDEISKNIFFLRSDIAYETNDWLKIKLGTSFIITSISAEGGEDTLNNGDYTETYYFPEERSNAFNQTLDIGVEFFNKEHGVNLQALIYAWNESEQRMYTLTASYIYKLDFKELF